MFDGILIIDKPEDWTSHDVVGKTRRILQTKRVGHTGTLDPFATGVLVVLVGKATRLAQFLDKDAKGYEATVRLGFETDTGDRTGERRITNYELRITNEELHDVSSDEIEKVLEEFRGNIEQTPPMYSAKKIDGKKLYELARKGIEIKRQPVNISIYDLRVSDQKLEHQTADGRPATFDFQLEVLCSAGTYIRVLAEDIGKNLGTGAHLAELRRTRAGKFNIDRAVTLEELQKLADAGQVGTVLISMNEAVSHLAEIKLSESEILKITHGMKLLKKTDELKTGDFLRLTSGEELLAIGVYDESDQSIWPKLVLT